MHYSKHYISIKYATFSFSVRLVVTITDCWATSAVGVIT